MVAVDSRPQLRLLVVSMKRGKPLLKRLADLTGDKLTLTLIDAPIEFAPGVMGGDTITIEQWLDLVCFWGGQTDAGELGTLTHRQFISVWASQYGAAHEDWDLDPIFHSSLTSYVWIAGVPASNGVLVSLAEDVLVFADGYLEGLTDEKLEAAEAELRERRDGSAPECPRRGEATPGWATVRECCRRRSGH